MRKVIRYIEDAFDMHTPPDQAYVSVLVVLASVIAFLWLLREVVFIILEVIT